MIKQNLSGYLKTILVITFALALVACGFKMKGTTELPFTSLYTNVNTNSSFGAQLVRHIRSTSPHTHLTEQRSEAEVYLQQIHIHRTRNELTLDAEGRVEEYELVLNYQFSLLDNEGNVILPPTTIRDERIINYNEDESAAGSAQISFMFENMETNLVNRIIRAITSEDVIERYQSLHP